MLQLCSQSSATPSILKRHTIHTYLRFWKVVKSKGLNDNFFECNRKKFGSKLTVIICKNKIFIQKEIENNIKKITVQRIRKIVMHNLLINNKYI